MHILIAVSRHRSIFDLLKATFLGKEVQRFASAFNYDLLCLHNFIDHDKDLCGSHKKQVCLKIGQREKLISSTAVTDFQTQKMW